MKTFAQFRGFIKRNVSVVFILFLFAAFLEAFTVYFISQERYVYAWDYAAYFKPYISMYDLAKTGITSFSNEVLASFSYDYNLLADVPLLLFRILFGPSRVSYIASILTMYAFPSVFLFIFMVKKSLSSIVQNQTIIVVASILTILLNPFFIAGVYFGFVDVFGVGIICYIYMRFFLSKKHSSVVDHLFLGVIFVVLLLFRRSFGFWIASFIITYSGFQLYKIIRVHDYRFSVIVKTFGKILLTGTTFLSLLFLVAKPIATKALFENYANIYDAYKNHPLIIFRDGLRYNLGPVGITLLIIGMYIGFSAKKLRSFFVFIFIQALITLFSLTRIQNVMDHQYYLFYPALLYFMVLPVVFLLNVKARRQAPRVFVLLLFFYGLVNFFIFFVPGLDSRTGAFRFLFPSNRHYPLIRNDFKELGRLVGTLSQLNMGSPGDIYLFAISNEYNNDIVRNYCVMYTNYKKFCSRMLWSNDIDKRDGFPIQLLTSKYIVVSDSEQFLIGERQHVVGDLIDDFLLGGKLSKSFEKLSYEFTLDDNVKVYIFKKRSPISPQTIDSLSTTFQSYYPGNSLFRFSASDINQNNSYE